MNPTDTAPKEAERKPPTEEPGAAIDTSKMSAGQRAALELTEAARDAATERGSFAGGLFMGRFGLDAGTEGSMTWERRRWSVTVRRG